MNELAKVLIFFGSVLLVCGILLMLFGKIPGLGRLPGDIYIKKGDFVFYFPLATCLLLSLILTLIFMFFGRR